jgi:hypothetical protein
LPHTVRESKNHERGQGWGRWVKALDIAAVYAALVLFLFRAGSIQILHLISSVWSLK